MTNPYTRPTSNTGKANGEAHPSAVSRSMQELRQVLQGFTRYLRTRNLPTMRRDLETRVREHPLATMMIGFGVGYLLGKLLK